MRLKKKPEDALALIDQAAQHPSLDDLAARARKILALAEPSEADLRVLVTHWRQQRAAWNSKKEAE